MHCRYSICALKTLICLGIRNHIKDKVLLDLRRNCRDFEKIGTCIVRSAGTSMGTAHVLHQSRIPSENETTNITSYISPVWLLIKCIFMWPYLIKIAQLKKHVIFMHCRYSICALKTLICLWIRNHIKYKVLVDLRRNLRDFEKIGTYIVRSAGTSMGTAHVLHQSRIPAENETTNITSHMSPVWLLIKCIFMWLYLIKIAQLKKHVIFMHFPWVQRMCFISL